MRSSKNKPTFTLIECLVSLVVLSSIFLSMTFLINQANQVNKYLQRKDQKEWLIFLVQFEEEIKHGENILVKDDRVYYEISDKAYYIEQYKNMIRKRGRNGGHQPMLTAVNTWTVKENETTVTFLISFENGEEYEGVWTKSKNGTA